MLPPPGEQRPYGAPGSFRAVAGRSAQRPGRGDRIAPAAQRALSVGDARRAHSLVERAKSLDVAADPIDNPEKLDHTISRYSDLMAERPPGATPSPGGKSMPGS